MIRLDFPRSQAVAFKSGASNLAIETGPVHLLTERRATGVEVVRLDEPAWCFMAELCAGHHMQAALKNAGDFDCSTALAEHLALGRFVAFGITHEAATTSH